MFHRFELSVVASEAATVACLVLKLCRRKLDSSAGRSDILGVGRHILLSSPDMKRMRVEYANDLFHQAHRINEE